MTGTSFQALVNLTMHANWSSVTLLYQTNIAAALHLQVGLMLKMIDDDNVVSLSKSVHTLRTLGS